MANYNCNRRLFKKINISKQILKKYREVLMGIDPKFASRLKQRPAGLRQV